MDERHPPDAAAMHVPVLRERVLALLAPALLRADAVVVDATVGLGGHAAALLAAHPQLRLIGIDRDPQALERSADRLAAHRDRMTLVHAVYDALPDVLASAGVARVDGILFDLGVSSLQLDDAERGFAYSRDTALDMRMDSEAPLTAADVVNDYPVERLTTILSRYGEERFARRIAEAIVRERARAPFTSSARLAELVRESVPAATRRTGGHPAKRTFQALRIEVNDELGALARALPAAIDAIRVGGRIVVLSYQSLEDRMVKRALAAAATSTAPPDLPVVPASAEPQLRLLTRGAERPSDDEVAANPRAASARLRAAERVRDAA
ncbi:MAG TPA: 16S rRNA (cytosine(1402)-N(4))-methyltransferase RsmH [Mycobacteriales bacterium]|jgi:16S rRNA (cytosine1402-N4)-methyltransferase|nr:16S rRNA (cytosine(1402)-N(4))-methyltransferase RsmH [Mycobacteriales bacterium]